MIPRRCMPLVSVLAASAFGLLSLSAPAATASSNGGSSPGPVNAARFGTAGSATPIYGSRTIPHWSFTYTHPANGQSYTETMVGTDPRSGGTTTVKTEIIPLEFTFVAAGQDMSAISNLYGYNAVPQSQGVAYQRVSGAVAGIVDSTWFSTLLQQLMGSLQIDATTVPIFLTHNVLLYDGHNNYTNCCTLGYHGAAMPIGHGAGQANGQGNNPVQTFIYAAYTSPNTYTGFSPVTSPRRGLSDIHALSHEVGEWLDDPFVNNAVQPWQTPTAPQYGCTSLLEVGDPVVGVWFPMPGNPDAAANGVWHPEDVVNANWFSRDGTAPLGLGSWDGRYTFMGARTTSIPGGYSGFASVAQGCS